MRSIIRGCVIPRGGIVLHVLESILPLQYITSENAISSFLVNADIGVCRADHPSAG